MYVKIKTFIIIICIHILFNICIPILIIKKLLINEKVSFKKKLIKNINKKDKHNRKSMEKSNNTKSISNHHTIKSQILKVIRSKILCISKNEYRLILKQPIILFVVIIKIKTKVFF